MRSPSPLEFGVVVPNLAGFTDVPAPTEFLPKSTPIGQLIEAVDRLLESRGKKKSSSA